MKNKKLLMILVIIICIFILNARRVDSREKSLYYDNFRYTDNVEFRDKFDYKANLVNIGDYYEITFDVVNESNNKYEVKDLLLNNNDKYFSYELVYMDNSRVNIGDKIDKNSTITMKYRVDYKKQVTNNNGDLDTSFNIEFGQLYNVK